MELFKLFGSILVDNDKANKSIHKTDKEASGLANTLGSAFATAGKAVATGATVAATAMAGLTVKALNMAGELEQNIGGSQAVFAEFADTVQGKAKEAFSQMGLATSDYLATANKMGALFQGAGFTVEESMSLSSQAMQRAADVASIMGIDTSAAMEAVAGAAKGNFTMMDNLGVAINDTTLQQYALSQGIQTATKDMTTQEKVGLAMQLFMEKTAYAAGNYAKENESLAGALNTAKAALANFLDGSGGVDELVGSFKNASEVIIKNIKELAPRLISGITDLINAVMPLIPDLIATLLPVVLEGATALMVGLVQSLPMILQTLIDALPMIINAFSTMVLSLTRMIPQLIVPLVEQMPVIIGTLVTALMQALPQILEAGTNILLGLLTGILGAIVKIPETIELVWDAIVGGIKELFGIQSPSIVMMEIGTFIMQGLIDGVTSLLAVFSAIWTAIHTNIANVFNNVKATVIGAIESVKTTISTGMENAKKTISDILDSIELKFTTIWESAKKIVSDAIEKIKGFFDFEWKLPDIKLPHFSISGEFSLNPPSIPSIGVEWYKKAYDNPMLMDNPTIFGYNSATGQFMGGGDGNGTEVVSGANTLMGMIQSAVATQNDALVVVLYKILEAILTLDENMGGHLREALAGTSFEINKREFARLVKGVT
ncbi:MAG: hypothetical protein IKU47_03350 [Oscillospiraceae bacterium]|nr:hypothetical protein [Oscillospiraceae bacterium]